MEEIKFQGELREKTGKGVARQARRSGFIPGVLYGQKDKPVSIKVEKKSAERIIRRIESRNVMADLVLKKDGKVQIIKTIVKEIQIEPITGEILHLDFYRMRMDKPILIGVPVYFVGESVGVKEGGVLEQELREVKVEALPKDIPEKIEVNIAELKIGDTVFARDLKLSEGVKLAEEGERVVLSVLAPMKEEEVVKVAEEVEAEPEVISEEKAEERRRMKEEAKGEEKEEVKEATKEEMKKKEEPKKEVKKESPEGKEGKKKE